MFNLDFCSIAGVSPLALPITRLTIILPENRTPVWPSEAPSRPARRNLWCCGELGKEVVIEIQRLGVEVITVDRYANAPAMQVAHRSYVINMLDGAALRKIVEEEKPDLIVPEIEAIATETLLALEVEGFNVIPTARATQITMNREGIRRLAAEELGLTTSPYRFADSEAECRAAMAEIGLPCVVKPVMSSSGKGQSTAYTEADVASVWTYSQEGGRTGKSRIIVEGFVDFDYGHRQEDGDYQESWQPHPMSAKALEAAQEMARKVTEALGGFGLFGVELFIRGDEVIFSEVSPRPHDTGLVTLISQDLSEFALHARAILGLPIPAIRQFGPAASAVILGHGTSSNISFENVEAALAEPDTQIRLFGKPEINGSRRLGLVVARGESVETARAKAARAASAVKIIYG